MTNILDEAKFLAGKIAKNYNPKKIVLFGSVARGTNSSNSDIDFLIIKESSQTRPFRIKKVFESIRGVKRNYPLDTIVYTPSEIENPPWSVSPFVRHSYQ